ncbi:LLM class flavin-dependent oxidoreductase [Paenibacillus sp. N3/727]|uniref:LLM class flavin-dependent oxidoreductase n=1 Tax=Paenibacillus sp. N3/727 TaxID=2925845 RepID=UPI001F53B023|nr:LLM class flavin-dependent oxidoreductase [Paenibacillus sp. N3/727]UNK16925.1 LLM class flavin-dependent oxidoreductase [Paenibacillus sp. N3/727]
MSSQQQQRQLHLGLFLFGTGYHPAGWRLPEGRTDGAYDPHFLKEIAQKLEQAKFDFFFLGDRLATSADMQFLFPSQMNRLEPFTMLSYLAAVTEKIGLIGTVNTTYAEPYNIARMTASLDHLSGGRASWNVVTGSDTRAAQNFSREKHWDNAKRYDYAEEFIDVISGLWDTWEDDALPRDKESGVFADGSKVHELNHSGEHFSVAGPLNVARPIQGQLPLITAGTSPRSQLLAAKYSDMVFTGTNVKEVAQAFYKEVKSKLREFGRADSDLKVLPGLVPIVGRTDEEARAKYNELNSLVVTDYDLKPLSDKLGIDLTGIDLNAPLPDLSSSEVALHWAELAKKANGREDITLRDLFYFFTVTVRGHLLVVGSPERIADLIEEWFVDEAADGFNVCPPYMPGGLDLFLELVVPELQRRDIFRTEYEGSTFRDHLGLGRPGNRFELQLKG